MMREPSAVRKKDESSDVVGAEHWADVWLAKPPDYPPIETEGRFLMDA